jgi:hypothetical protein
MLAHWWQTGNKVPVFVSGTIVDLSGRTLSGQVRWQSTTSTHIPYVPYRAIPSRSGMGQVRQYSVSTQWYPQYGECIAGVGALVAARTGCAARG